jgi:hypothetical protein
MMTSLRESILSADDMKRELISIPEWNIDLYVCVMTGTERDTFESSIEDLKKDEQNPLINFRARLAIATCEDETGAKIFKSTDVDSLGLKSGAALTRVFNVAIRINHLSDKDIEELEKN